MKNSYYGIAERNLKTAKTLLDAEDFNESARYCQQYLEKTMKGYIEEHGDINDLKLLSTHSPVSLFTRFCQLLGETRSNEDKRWMSAFKTYYYDINYPGANFIEVEESEAQEAYDYVLRFKERYGHYFISKKPKSTYPIL